MFKKFVISLLVLGSPLVFAQPFEQTSHSQTVFETQSSSSHLLEGPGMRVAQSAATGRVATEPLNYAQLILVGIAIITNNNDNDGQPATFTGGSGSNMASGG